ncbi:MAG TPA: hypothetical protein DF699_11695, partial [Phycisphaerales bacterium]|nr:hypothetical protein [Phycisphaerales bacterium]
MDNIKPWQIILILFAFAALGFSIFKFAIGSDLESQLANSLTLVDVETGQLYSANITGSRTLLIPATRPDSDLQALIPVYE